ncbi:hypothetical protein D3C72_1465510 [compost metagenome]
MQGFFVAVQQIRDGHPEIRPSPQSRHARLLRRPFCAALARRPSVSHGQVQTAARPDCPTPAGCVAPGGLARIRPRIGAGPCARLHRCDCRRHAAAPGPARDWISLERGHGRARAALCGRYRGRKPRGAARRGGGQPRGGHPPRLCRQGQRVLCVQRRGGGRPVDAGGMGAGRRRAHRPAAPGGGD